MDAKDYAERQRSITAAEQAATLEERLDPVTDADRPDLDRLEEDIREWKYVAMTQPIATLRWLVAAARDRDEWAAVATTQMAETETCHLRAIAAEADRDRLAAELAELRAAAAAITEFADRHGREVDWEPLIANCKAALARLLPARPEGTP